jgi:hypothetical protein
LISHTSNSQIIDNYGIRSGISISNQHWTYTNIPGGWSDNITGLIVLLNAEKQLNKYFSLRPELGYIQKGFKSSHIFSAYGEEFYRSNIKVKLHDLSLNIGMKISFFDTKFKPYIIVGLHGDYMLGYNCYDDTKYVDLSLADYFDNEISKFNKFTLSGIIGIGCVYNEFIYFDLEYNPALTNNLKDENLKVKSRYFGITLGININKLITNK